MAYSPITIKLTGGLDLSSADGDVRPGMCRRLDNIEITTDGRYQRVQGYERFDGRPSPSDVRLTDLPGFPFDDADTALQALYDAMEARRLLITEVPGGGPVSGGFVFNGEVYALRDNMARNAAFLHKATASGWQAVPTPALLPGGRLFTRQANFAGAASVEIIGTDGKNPAFRFDGTTYTQITGPIAPDAPILCEVLPSQILMLAYRGGSVVTSAVGDPTKWTPTDGGVEFALGDEVTALAVQPGDTCAIGCKNRTYMLYGRVKEDFALKDLSTKVGMRMATAQQLSDTLFLDDRGLTTLARVQQFGDFDQATISQKVKPLLDQYLGRDVCAITVKTKNQYRLFFTDGAVLTTTFMADGAPQFTTASLNAPIVCAFSGESMDGKEVIFAGSDDGYLYQLDKGNSFDGAAYTDVIEPPFLNFGSPEQKKQWHKLVVECDSLTQVQMSVSAYFDYMQASIPDSQLIIGGGDRWDLAEWDNAIWGNSAINWGDFYIDGRSRNVSFTLSSTSDRLPPHIISALYLHAAVKSRRR